MFSNILVATDFSDSSRAALLEAISLGKRSLSKIHAVHVITYLEDIFRAGRYPIPDTKWRKAIQQRLDEFFPKSIYPNSKRQTMIGGSIAEELLRYARLHQCGLVVTGSHGRRSLKRVLLGSVTTTLMRASQTPVMVVRDEGEFHRSFERILVPIDFSGTSVRALNFAVRLAEFLESEVHLVHVVDLPALKTFKHTYRLPNISIPKDCELNVDLTLNEMIENCHAVFERKVKTCVGDPAEEIMKYASEENCDLIVMGTHGRNGLERILMGSVTTSILANVTIPVITISSSEHVLNHKMVQENATAIAAIQVPGV